MTHPWLPLHLLADDLTGALDSAAAFGAGVPVHLDRPPAHAERPGPAVAVLATATRDVAPPTLPGHLAPVLPWWADAGIAFKKVDSLLRGNTLAEVAWLTRAGGFGRVVMAPALPAQGRYTLGGRLAVAPAGAPWTQAEARGPQLAQALHALDWPADCALHLPDVRDDATLDALLGEALPALAGPQPARPTLWCGSAGLAAAWARALKPVRAAPPGCPAPATASAATGAVWVVGASHQAIARAQWDRAQAAWPQALTVRHGQPQALAQACAVLRNAAAGGPGPVLIDLAPLHPLTAAEAATLLHTQVAALTALPPPARLLVLGGDTALALARATGVQAMVSGLPGRPGWGQARWQGGRWHGLLMDCRSGAFGAEDDLCRALEVVMPA
ncbi:four-carbon acid sugar kinase family protein [Ideonella livida]|uniref:Four-carbon acid sugar kinase family protein n=1 Tax=Ideonella livida TaxID=2707176 RepID=A0A7C9PI11_9BURK|nr:four-carbon acid sugar kinase family protein [Ideonella livida]NDY92497.1 four-carbon acid sugar kinase family protein [Ideonella livida]